MVLHSLRRELKTSQFHPFYICGDSDFSRRGVLKLRLSQLTVLDYKNDSNRRAIRVSAIASEVAISMDRQRSENISGSYYIGRSPRSDVFI